MLKFDFSENGFGIVSLTHFVYDSSRQIILRLYSKFYILNYTLLTDQISLRVAFNSLDIEQYVYCNCLLTGL